MGRDWLQKIQLDWKRLYRIEEAVGTSIPALLKKHSKLFEEGLGLVKGREAKVHVDPEAQPRFYRPRPVPYALRSKVDEELQRLERMEIIEPTEFSNWAAPIVPVVKQDGSVRICGDYKLTINQVAKLNKYPLPKIEELLASLAGGKRISKLDLAHAYLQIPLDEESKKYVTVNTHRGLYRYNRLPFGVAASAPSIFQRMMESILQGISNICIYIDDILVTGPSEEEHLKTLDLVMTKLEESGIKLKLKKCKFLLETVEYLGHQISAKGVSPTQEKIKAILEAPRPKNVTQLCSFLGMVNYYGKFLSHLASTLAPLYQLLQKNEKWNWGKQQDKAFKEAKKQLSSPLLLVHYDPSRELLLACDASPYGLGVVLSHVMDNKTERPIAFAS